LFLLLFSYEGGDRTKGGGKNAKRSPEEKEKKVTRGPVRSALLFGREGKKGK